MLLEKYLKPLSMSQVESAAKLGVSFPRLNEIVKGKRAVTPGTALRLGRVLGMSAKFWLRLQSDWDLWNAVNSVNYRKIEQLKPFKPLHRALQTIDPAKGKKNKRLEREQQ
jgi:addiction module HigA family antidote